MTQSMAHRGMEDLSIATYFSLMERLRKADDFPTWLADAIDPENPPPLDVIIIAAAYGYTKLLDILVYSPDHLSRSSTRDYGLYVLLQELVICKPAVTIGK